LAPSFGARRARRARCASASRAPWPRSPEFEVLIAAHMPRMPAAVPGAWHQQGRRA
jgi:hypothetical protein